MIKKILLNDSDFQFDAGSLPCLIHGKAHEGSSLFTVSLVANFYKQDFKILFLSGYPMAKEELINQIGVAPNSKIVFLQKETADRFPKLVSSLSNPNEWIVLIKNIDLFDPNIFLAVGNINNLILSGDLDQCNSKEIILKRKFASKILFSKPTSDIEINIPELKKYEGYFIENNNAKGIVKLID